MTRSAHRPGILPPIVPKRWHANSAATEPDVIVAFTQIAEQGNGVTGRYRDSGVALITTENRIAQDQDGSDARMV
jgi:hypothetical protein